MARSRCTRSFFLCTVVGVATLITGCTAGPASTNATTTATTMSSATVLTADRGLPTDTVNDLGSGSAHHQLAVDGESFRLKVDYFSTGDTKNWTSLGPKNVHLLAYLNPAADSTAPQVVIDNFQAQYRLLAANTELDGLVVDSVTDQAGATPFLITPKVSYGSVVATTGVTPDLLARWQSLGGRLPLDETALRTAGVAGFTVTFTFRLLVRNTGDAGSHRRTVTDQLTVPVVPAAVSPTTSARPTTG